MELIRVVAAWAAALMVVGLGTYVLFRIYRGKIDLDAVVGDKNGDASMGRFQILIFTFVVAFCFLYVVTAPNADGLPDVPASVLTMLGISGSAFLVSKGIDGETESDPPKAKKDG
jgi:FtsH-binding integral membrane protein